MDKVNVSKTLQFFEILFDCSDKQGSSKVAILIYNKYMHTFRTKNKKKCSKLSY